MKLITYMMQYLTSIPSQKNSEEENKIKDLEKRIEALEANVSDLAYCIQQIAGTITTIVTPPTQSSNPVDDYLDSLSKDDDDTGYLH